ncbi:hypothetical protein LCGC14_2068760 [marine sediment metagenome]|uniref:Uncharacterized protein n=1 Tax=marine sediment metagenome TaxID=412755 RepID=A0A0F9GXF2_9ZZZZ
MEGKKSKRRSAGKKAGRKGPTSKARCCGSLASECRRYRKWHDRLGFESQLDAIYCLPGRLLDLADEVVSGLFTDEALHFERSFAAWCQGHSLTGLFGGRPLAAGPLDLADVYARADYHLERRRWARRSAMARQGSSSEEEPEYEATGEFIVQDRLRGYVGWIVTNSDYVKDRNQLRALAAKEGVVSAGEFPALVWSAQGQAHAQRRGQGKGFMGAYSQFCAKWCLRGLLSWDLPQPMGPQLPGDRSPTVPEPIVGLRIFLPITLRVPKSLLAPQRLGQWRKQTAAGGSVSCSHLQEWIDLDVRPRANQRSRYSDLFVIWFYWRVLRERYAQAIRGRTPDVHIILNRLVEGRSAGTGQRAGEKARVRIREARRRLRKLADA